MKANSCYEKEYHIIFFFSFIFISWRLITLQYCSGFCHTLTWISHGVTCIPQPDPPSHHPLDSIPLALSHNPLTNCLNWKTASLVSVCMRDGHLSQTSQLMSSGRPGVQHSDDRTGSHLQPPAKQSRLSAFTYHITSKYNWRKKLALTEYVCL